MKTKPNHLGFATISNIQVILLAAGLSRRMGEANKMLLPFGNATILETTLQNILKADIGQVILVTGYQNEKLKEVLLHSSFLIHHSSLLPPLSIIENPDYEQGMTTSIQMGLRQFNNSHPSFFICLADMPLIQADEYCYLAQQFLTLYETDDKAIVQPCFQGKPGNPVIFSPFYADLILNLAADTEGGKSILKTHQNHVHLIEMPTHHILQDIDDKKDYQNLKT